MLEYWDKLNSGRWPENQSSSPDVSEDQGLMHDLLTELTKQEADTWSKPWVRPLPAISLPNIRTFLE